MGTLIAVPLRVAREYFRVLFREHLPLHGFLHHRLPLPRRWARCRADTRPRRRILAQRLMRRDRYPRGRPARTPPPAAATPDNSRAPADSRGLRNCDCPTARGHGQLLLGHRRGDFIRKRAAVADAGGAADSPPGGTSALPAPAPARRLPDNPSPLSIPARGSSSPTASMSSPRSTAFFATSPAAIITLGFDVLVQLVMAAITTLPS